MISIVPTLSGVYVVTFLSVFCNKIVGPELTSVDEQIVFNIKKPLKVQRKDVMSVSNHIQLGFLWSRSSKENVSTFYNQSTAKLV